VYDDTALLKADDRSMADHQTWHEGYLSRAKDHIISNGRLAMAAQETALDKDILTKSFIGKKWKQPPDKSGTR
jgi:endoribonuclease Dicer